MSIAPVIAWNGRSFLEAPTLLRKSTYSGLPWCWQTATIMLTAELRAYCRYAFNAWIPLITYNTAYAPRFLVGNTTTVALIICAAATLTLAVLLQRRDVASDSAPSRDGSEDGTTDAERVVLGASDRKHLAV